MKRLLCLGLLMGACFAHAAEKSANFFPYPYSIDDLPNGLRLVTVPTDHPNLVALYIVVSTGSRNEVEPGKSGYAHFFEHMMFRGSENVTPEQRDAILKKAGAQSNAYTSDDRTVYHELFAKEDLDAVMKIEADRFQRLKYAVGPYKTESLAVLGEYNKNSSSPGSKLYEVLRETAFSTHTYKHTTMGFIKDIEDMPNQYDYSLEFYKRYYRPEYCTVLLVGDIKREQSLELTRKYFGEWKRGEYQPKIPKEPPQEGPRTGHVDWPSPTLPYMVIAFHGPAFSVENREKIALDFLVPIAFGEDSELYQKLVLNEQKVEVLGPSFDDNADPELFSVFALVKDAKDVSYVQEQILATFKRFSTELVPQQKLDETRSRMRYGTALGLNSANSIAGFLAPYIALTRTPASIDQAFKLAEQVTPEEIRANATKYFTEANRTIVTLQTKKASK